MIMLLQKKKLLLPYAPAEIKRGKKYNVNFKYKVIITSIGFHYTKKNRTVYIFEKWFSRY